MELGETESDIAFGAYPFDASAVGVNVSARWPVTRRLRSRGSQNRALPPSPPPVLTGGGIGPSSGAHWPPSNRREEAIALGNLEKRVGAFRVKNTSSFKQILASRTDEGGTLNATDRENNKDVRCDGYDKDNCNDDVDNRTLLLKKVLRNHPIYILSNCKDTDTDWYTSDFISECVCWHNVYRQRHGSPPLAMCPDLCSYAQDWANTLAHMNIFYYRPKVKDIGQSIYCRLNVKDPADVTGKEVAGYWYKACKYYDFLKEPSVLHVNVNAGMNLGNAVKRITTHYKCRNGQYPKSANVFRFPVPDDKVSWDVSWDGYKPVEYTSKSVLNQPWADPALTNPEFKPLWHSLDGSVDRRSHVDNYQVVNRTPLNPVGRTGVIGRGNLGRWGPNHAADPIVTRWKRNKFNEIEKDVGSGKPILQFVAIERKDCHEWAIPGGMVDPGEHVSATLKREFMEEALNSLCMGNQDIAEIEKSVGHFFENGIDVYKGYVDDPRNTDNAWMETVATNFHDHEGNVVGSLQLSAGDDAARVKWMDLHSSLNLYASHSGLLKAVAEIRGSFW